MSNLPQARVAVVGGGLAGLAAASALIQRGCRVELFEARRLLGGRASSFRDPESGQWVDHCQHVAMGCCSCFLDFCRQLQVDHLFRRDETLHFLGPRGQPYRLRGARWLPAPLHLLPSFVSLGYLSVRERFQIARALWKLQRMRSAEAGGSIGQWLREQGQSERAIERFWSVVLVSALAESVDRASLSAARKVFVDGFLTSADAYHLLLPKVPLGELYECVAARLQQRGAAVHLGARVRRVEGSRDGVQAIVLDDGQRVLCDFMVVALPWRVVQSVFPEELLAAVPSLQAAGRIASSPITSVHLWFDRPFTTLPHAVLVERLSQWVFYRGEASDHAPSEQSPLDGTYYQVVISASGELRRRPREQILEEVLADLAAVWPAAREANLLRWRIVTQHDAVFSVSAEIEAHRPEQRTEIPNLMLAGDWTRTGWPATMEGAVRSGYLAAEAITEQQ